MSVIRPYRFSSFAPTGGLYNGLVAHWSMDEESGDRLDSHTGGLDLSEASATPSSFGVLNNSAQINSSTLSRASNDVLTGTSEKTIAFAFRRGNMTANVVRTILHMGSDGAGTELQIALETADGYLRIRFGTGNYRYYNLSYDDDIFRHIILTITENGTRSNLSLYVNNVAKSPASGSGSDVINLGSDYFVVGDNNDSTETFQGEVDHLSIWNRILTTDERTQLYNYGKLLPYSSFASPPVYGTNGLLTSLKAYWTLDEGDAPSVGQDSHGSYHLTENNSVIGTNGVMGPAVFLNATAYFSRASNDIFAGSGAKSISFRFKSPIASGSYIMYIGDIPTGEQFQITLESSGTKFWIRCTSNTKNWTGDFSNNQWQHAVLTMPSGATVAEVKLYINGSENTTGSSSGSTTLNIASTYCNIGANRAASTIYDGSLDEIAIWDKELSASEVSDLYNGGDQLPYGAFD